MSGVFPDLRALAAKLRGQAESTGAVYLTQAEFWGSATRVVDLMYLHLGRGDLKLQVDKDKIPSEPGTSLEFDAYTSVADDTFLGLVSTATHIEFRLVGSDNEVNFTLTVCLDRGKGGATGWTFATSYPALVGDPTVDEVSFTAPRFVFDTYPGATPLTFSSPVNLIRSGSPLALIRTLLGSSVPSGVEVNGVISPGPSPRLTPRFDLQGPPLTEPLKLVGLVNIGSPSLRIRTVRLRYVDSSEDGGAGEVVETDEGTYLAAQWFVGALVTIGGIDLLFAASASEPLNEFWFSVTPESPAGMTLDEMVAALLDPLTGNSFKEFFTGVPFAEDFLQGLLGAFAVRGFNALCTLGTKPATPRVLCLSVAMGSVLEGGKPKYTLPIIPGELVAEDFEATWVVFEPLDPRRRQMMVTVEARLTFAKGYPFQLQISVPDFTVAGRYVGPPITLSLQDLANEVLKVKIPLDLEITFTGLSFQASPPNAYTMTAQAGGQVELFDTRLLAVRDAELTISRTYRKVLDGTASDPTNAFSFQGVIEIGKLAFDVNARVGNGDTVIGISMVGQTLGGLLTYLVSLVDPYLDLRLESPWDTLNAINLDALRLTINITRGTVSIDYPIHLDLGFVTLTNVGLTYTKARVDTGKRTPASLVVDVSGSFLGISYGQGNDKPPLSWNPVTDRAPAVPNQGNALFDLQYLGLGQRVRLKGSDLTSIEKIFAAMSKAMVPLTPGATDPTTLSGIVFDADAGWLIAARFTVLNTVSIAGVFNDPTLAGIRVSLAGEKAGKFDGLAFEILYVRIAPNLGLYHLEVQLPIAMRQLEFGAVSVTLPVVTLDLYTNGNFRVDFGFPKRLDFTRSFSIQVFPFVGFGGFYFGLLSGETSGRVPQVTNGRFSPVVEAGIGLSLGVGKTIEKGIFSAGASVTLVGIVEGVIGWFEPSETSVRSDRYYWVQGTVALAGQIFGRIDFGIISVDVELSAYAQVSFTIEAYEPIYVALQVNVTARASIKVLFVRIHFSFTLHLDLAFTIGSKGTPPWLLAPRRAAEVPARAVRPLARPAARPLAAQAARRPVYPALSAVHAPREDWLGLIAPPPPRADFTSRSVGHLLAGAAPARQELDIFVVPAFTLTDGGDRVACVPLPFVGNAISPGARTAGETRDVADGAADASFNQFVVRLFVWALAAIRPDLTDADSEVTFRDLEYLAQRLYDPAIQKGPFSYAHLREFLASNFVVRLAARTPGTTAEMSGTLFPVLPELTLSVDGSTIDFATWTPVDTTYQATIDTYLAQLAVAYENDVQKKDDATDTGEFTDTVATPSADEPPSMAALVFQNYCAMLARAVANSAAAVMRAYPYQVPDPSPSITQIAASFPPAEAWYVISRGDTLADLADRFGVTADVLRQRNPLLGQADDHALPVGGRLTVPVVVTPATIVAANLTTPSLLAQTPLPLSGVQYQVRAGDTFTSIATALTAGRTVTPHGTALAEALVAANADVPVARPGAALPIDDAHVPSYTTQQGDTLALVAATYMVRTTGASVLNLLTDLRELVREISELNPKPDQKRYGPDEPLPDDTPMHLPTDLAATGTRTARMGETITRLAATLLAVQAPTITLQPFVAALTALNDFGVAPDPYALITAGRVLKVPPLTPVVQPGDTLDWIARTFGIAQGSTLGALFLNTPNLLAVGAVLLVPPIKVTPSDTDTLSAIASAYNLSPDELTTCIAETSGILAPATVITVPHVPALKLGQLQHDLLYGGDLNTVAASVSRFLLYGLRLPEPATTGPLAASTLVEAVTGPLYGLVGQQFTLPDPLPADADFAVSNSGGADWVQLYMGSYVVQRGDTLDTITTRFAPADQTKRFSDAVKQLNPDVDFTKPLVVGTGLVFPGASTYRTVQDDTRETVTSRFAASGMATLFAAELQVLNPGVDFTRPLPVGTELVLPVTDSYTVVLDDTLTTIAARFVPADQAQEFSDAVKRLTPDVDFDKPLVAGAVLALPVVSLRIPVTELEISYAKDERDVIEKLRDARFDPQGLTVERLPLFREVPDRHAFQQVLHWQCAQPPRHSRLVGVPPTGEPTIWPFPASLRSRLSAVDVDGPEPCYQLMTTQSSAPTQRETTAEVGHYAWATAVDIPVRRVMGDDGPLTGHYLVLGADDVGRAQLELLWNYLNGMGTTATATALLLYPPNPTSGNPKGLVGDVVDPERTFLVKTNLSTISSSGRVRDTHADADTDATRRKTYEYSATINSVKDFVRLLWQSSVVHGGGYYLHYATADGADLPDDVFNQSPEAMLTLLVLVDEGVTVPTPPPIRTAHNCAVVVSNIDAGSTNVFAQPLVHITAATDTLSSITASLSRTYKLTTDPGGLAVANADVKALLRPGATLRHPKGAGTDAYQVLYGDTFASIAAKLPGVDIPALGTANAEVAAFRPGALLQLTPGDLRVTVTTPAGTTGFRITRPEPAPATDSLGESVENLFQLLAFGITEGGGFRASPQGLPAGPIDSADSATDGFISKAVADPNHPVWEYTKLLPVAPYAADTLGADPPAGVSWGLPSPWADPYRGITTPRQSVTLDFAFRDTYGNTAKPVTPLPALPINVGYFDDLLGIDQWTSVAVDYAFLPGTPPTCCLRFSFDPTTYVAGPGLAVSAAIRNAATARCHYARIYYQVRQPDVTATLRSSLDQPRADPGQTGPEQSAPKPTAYPLAKPALLGLIAAAHTFLAAAENLQTWKHQLTSADTLATVADRYQLTVIDLARANATVDATTLLAAPATLQIPTFSVFRFGDTLAATTLTIQQVRQGNLDLPLNPGADLSLTSQPRSQTLQPHDTLRDIASRAHAMTEVIAAANDHHPLTADKQLRVLDTTLTVNKNDTLATMVERFAQLQVRTTESEIGAANQNLPDLFDPSQPTLRIINYIVQDGDALRSLTTGSSALSLETLWSDNATVPNVFPVGTALWTSNTPYTLRQGDTLATVASAHRTDLATLFNLPDNGNARLVKKATLTIPDQATVGPDTPGSVYTLQPTDTLNTVAAKYGQKVTGASLVTRNRYTPDVFVANPSFTVGGVTVPVTAADTFDTLYAKATKTGFTGDFDAFGAAVAKAHTTTSTLFTAGAVLVCPAMTVSAGGPTQPAASDVTPQEAAAASLDQVATTYGVSTLALVRANGPLRGLLRPDTTITYQAVTITTGSDDTLLTLTTRFTKKGVPLTLEQLATQPKFTAADMLTPGAHLVPPPLDATQAIPFTDTPRNPEPIFSVTVDIELTRQPERIDTDFADAPNVAATSTRVSPCANPDTDTAPTKTLHDFAVNFERAFPGLKTAVSRQDKPDTSQFWAIDFRDDHLGFDIAKTPAGKVNDKAAYYALPPLATDPLHYSDVPIQPYTNGKLQPTEARTFQAVDLDAWAETFLTALDTFLSPSYASAIRMVNPDALDAVIADKRTIADRLAGHIQPIFHSPAGDVDQARETLRQLALTELRNAYSIDTIVQLPITVTSPYKNPSTAPRLSGVPVVTTTTSDEDADNDSRGFSPAKVSLAESKNGATLTFGLTAKKPATERVVDVTMRYAISELEYDIRNVTRIADYQQSSWLSLILPIGAPANSDDSRGADVPTADSLAHNAFIGRLTIPVPLRACPTPPSMVTQSATPATSTPDLPSDPLDRLKQWEYAFSFTHPSANQDTRFVSVTFNGPAAAHTQQQRTPLFDPLAQFTSVYQAVQQDLSVLPTLTPDQSSPTAEQAVTVFAELAHRVAESWPKPGAETSAAPRAPGITVEYQVTTATVTNRSTMTLNLTTPPPTDVPWPNLYAGVRDPSHAMTTDPGNPSAPSRTYYYPDHVPQSTPTYIWVFPKLDVTRLQSGIAAARVVRNENLSTPEHTVNNNFVYRTALAEFANPLVPLLVHQDVVPIGEEGTTITAALQRVFAKLFTAQDWSAVVKLTASYSYHVHPKTARLLTLLPVFLITNHTLTNHSVQSFTEQAEANLNAWQKANKPNLTSAGYHFELTVFASKIPDTEQSILELRNLFYPLTANESGP